MRVGDLPPVLLYATGAALGAAGGVIAVLLADHLPSRYDIVLLVVGTPRRRRNIALVTLCAAVGLALAYLVGGYPESGMALTTLWFGTNLALSIALLSAAAVDVEHMILPNEITIGGALLALATAHWRSVGLTGSAWGAVLGFLVTAVPHVVYKRLRGKAGQGMGDTKLVVLAGAWHGVAGALFVLFAGAVQAVACALAMRAAGLTYAVPESVKAEIAELRAATDRGDAAAKALLEDDPMAADAQDGVLAARLPKGPFLVLACLEFLFAGREIVESFERYFGPG
jgi:leader peptidase (prepilin peptidase)/N-methyltransferase